VRSLERSIGSVCRAVAYKYAITEDPNAFKLVTVDAALIQDALGNSTADTYLHERIQSPGTAIGLAYTANGGRALLIETTKYAGSGKLVLTGQLGDVMKESVGTALSWIRSNAAKLGLIPELLPAARKPVVNVINSDEERI
jgi:ATP-dependent Lon protease